VNILSGGVNAVLMRVGMTPKALRMNGIANMTHFPKFMPVWASLTRSNCILRT
jgi:hypothetical protein